MGDSSRNSRAGLAFAVTRAILLFCVVIACAAGINSTLAEPLFGISLQISVWLLAFYFWLLALVELSPWPFLHGASKRPGLADTAVVIGTLLALLFFFIADRKAGQPIGLFAIVPALAATLLRLFLGLRGIELWKSGRVDGSDQSS